jgi:hypothetical protein
MLLLGITGAKGSGKGTVAQFVAEWATENGLLAIDRGFADKLKWAMARIFWPEITLEDALKWANEFKNENEAFACIGRHGNEEPDMMISGRQLFQHGGTEMGREIFGNNFWIDQLLPLDEATMLRNFSDENHALAHIATISDVRFENEARRIKELGGSVLYVVRPGYEPDGHVSEARLSDVFIDVVIGNDGNLNELREKVFRKCDEAIWGEKE